jgi:hypothetical protein
MTNREGLCTTGSMDRSLRPAAWAWLPAALAASMGDAETLGYLRSKSPAELMAAYAAYPIADYPWRDATDVAAGG